MSKETKAVVQQEDIDIQHDDEFEDFKIGSRAVSDEKKHAEWMDDWDDDNNDSFSEILKAQRQIVH